MLRYFSTTLAVVLLAGCASGGRTTQVNQPRGAPPPASTQALFESGRDAEAVVMAAAPTVSAKDVWYGSQGLLRMGQRAEAVAQLQRLRDTSGSDSFRRAAEVALARLATAGDAGAQARAARTEFPADPYVQFESGLTLALEGDHAAAAAAFDAALASDPMLAYAYYQAGLAYNRLERPDLTVARFETFVRLAPTAPERGQVDAVLRTARGAR